jgi:hypothetical protein
MATHPPSRAHLRFRSPGNTGGCEDVGCELASLQCRGPVVSVCESNGGYILYFCCWLAKKYVQTTQTCTQPPIFNPCGVLPTTTTATATSLVCDRHTGPNARSTTIHQCRRCCAMLVDSIVPRATRRSQLFKSNFVLPGTKQSDHRHHVPHHLSPLPPPRGSHPVFAALTPPHAPTRSADATRYSSSRLLARRTRRSHRFQKNLFFLVRSPCGGERPRRLHSRQNALHSARLLSPMDSTASIAGARVGCAWARRRVPLHQHHRHGRVTRRVWRAARPRCITYSVPCAQSTLLHHTTNKRVARNVWHAA